MDERDPERLPTTAFSIAAAARARLRSGHGQSGRSEPPRGGSHPAVRDMRVEVEVGDAQPAKDVSVWRLAWSYFKACAAAFLILFLLGTGFFIYGQPIAYSPLKLLTAAVFSWTFGLFLLPLVMLCVLVVAALRIPRGYADVLVGALVGSALVYWQVSKMGIVTAWALKLFVSATFGGYAFWRAEGMPGAPARSKPQIDATAGWLRRGLWLGTRLWR